MRSSTILDDLVGATVLNREPPSAIGLVVDNPLGRNRRSREVRESS
jgi:hypothetical protein